MNESRPRRGPTSDAEGALRLRAATAQDVPALASLYAASVAALAAAHYDADARRAWAAFARDDAFAGFVLGADTLVALRDGAIAGFAGLRSDGHVVSLYVAPDAARRGVARVLLDALLARARAAGHARLTTDASAVSRPVFERLGFRVVDDERVLRNGVIFVRHRMQCDLDSRSAD
jgi:putative acetyltransferase